MQRKIVFAAFALAICSSAQAAPKARARKSSTPAAPAPALRPELVIQRGHSGGVYEVRFTKDGRQLVSSGLDNAVRVWDLGSGLEIGTLDRTEGSYVSVGISADDKYVVAGQMHGAGRIWTLADGQVHCPGGVGKDTAVFATKDNKFLTVSPDRVGRLDPAACKSETVFDLPAVSADLVRKGATLLPDGRLVAVVDKWNQETGVVPPSYFVLFTADGKPLPPAPTRPYAVEKFVPTPDGERALVEIKDGKKKHLELIDLKTGELLRALTPPAEDETDAMVILADGKHAITVDWFRGALHRFDLDTGKEEWKVPAAKAIWKLTLSHDERLVAASQSDGGIFVWDVATGELIRDFDTAVRSLSDLALTDNDSKMVALTLRQGATIWDLVEGTITHVIPRKLDGWAALTAQRKGSAIVISADAEGLLNVFDAKTGALTRTIKFPDARVKGLAFSPDEKVLFCITWSRNAITALDFASGKVLGTWSEDTFTSRAGPVLVPLSLDDKQVAVKVFADKHWAFYDLATWQKTGEVLRDEKDNETVPKGFSPRSSRLPAEASFYDMNYDGVRKRDIATGAEQAFLPTDKQNTTALAVTLDGRYLVTASADGLIRFIETKTHKLVATLAAVGGKEPLIYTPDGYYKAAKIGRGVAFRVGRKPYPFESFDLKLNRPDLVLGRLGLAPQSRVEVLAKARAKRLKRMGYTEEMLGDEFVLPEVAVDNPPGTTTADKQLALKVSASDPRFELDRLFVSVNGVTLGGSAGIDLKAKHAKKAKETVEVALTVGVNHVQVSVLNARGIESARQSFTVRREGTAPPAKRWVVTIGVSKYKDADKNLNYAAKDAKDLASALGAQGPVFPETEQIVLLDEQATRSNIQAVRERLLHSKIEDQVIVFYAGHGILDDKLDYYLATNDMNFEKPADAGLPYEALESLLDGIPARQKILLIDACHSGEIDRETTTLVASVNTSDGAVKNRGIKKTAVSSGGVGLQSSFEAMRALFADLRRSSGAVVISSASGTQFALESSTWQNGVFTFALLDGLKNKRIPATSDGKVTVSKLRDYVIDKVQMLTSGQQTPTARQEQLADDFVIQ